MDQHSPKMGQHSPKIRRRPSACHVRKFRWHPPLSFPPPTPTTTTTKRTTTTTTTTRARTRTRIPLLPFAVRHRSACRFGNSQATMPALQQDAARSMSCPQVQMKSPSLFPFPRPLPASQLYNNVYCLLFHGVSACLLCLLSKSLRSARSAPSLGSLHQFCYDWFPSWGIRRLSRGGVVGCWFLFSSANNLKLKTLCHMLKHFVSSGNSTSNIFQQHWQSFIQRRSEVLLVSSIHINTIPMKHNETVRGNKILQSPLLPTDNVALHDPF